MAYGFDKEMPMIDGSTSTYPFTEAVYNALFHYGIMHNQFPKKHSKSHVFYERLIKGEVDILFASVYPASDILKLAEDNNVDLFYDTKTNLKLLAIDGIMPADETIADGSYPLSNNTYIVLRKDTPKKFTGSENG